MPPPVLAGVPTVCLGLADHMEQHRLRLSSLRLLVVGGAACPRCVLTGRFCESSLGSIGQLGPACY